MVPKILYEYINHPQKPFYYTYSTNMTTYNQYIYICIYLNICFIQLRIKYSKYHYKGNPVSPVQQSFPLFRTHTLIRKGFTTTESLQTMWHYISLCTARCSAFLEKKTVDRFLLQMMMCLTPTFFFPKKTMFQHDLKELLVRFSKGCGMLPRFFLLVCAVSVWQQLLLLSCASRKLCSKVACLAEHGEDGDMQGSRSMLGATARISLSPFKKTCNV